MFEHCNFGGPKRLVAVSGWHFVGPNALSGSCPDNVTNISRQCLGMDGPRSSLKRASDCRSARASERPARNEKPARARLESRLPNKKSVLFSFVKVRFCSSKRNHKQGQEPHFLATRLRPKTFRPCPKGPAKPSNVDSIDKVNSVSRKYSLKMSKFTIDRRYF
jgi:hypothetical protein